jgi:CIC family chloride channel protein
LEFPAFMLLGVVSAAVAIIFMASIMFADRVAGRVPAPEWLKPAAGGLAVGLIGIWFPHILGVGYGATDEALKAMFPLGLLLALIVLKTAATAISLGCRFGGGVFSPAIYLGAMTGGAFGLIAAEAFPDLASSHGVYALVGMSAVTAAVLGAPISTILIVFEMTGDYKVTIAVMVATTIASVIVQQALGKSFFHWQLEGRGLDLRGGRARHLLRALNVRDLMSRDFHSVNADASVGALKRTIGGVGSGDFVVTDAEHHLLGIFAFADLREVAFTAELDALVNAGDLVRAHAPVVTPGVGLERVIELMERENVERIAVVDTLDRRHVVGILHRVAVLQALNRALLEAQADAHDARA